MICVQPSAPTAQVAGSRKKAPQLPAEGGSVACRSRMAWRLEQYSMLHRLLHGK